MITFNEFLEHKRVESVIVECAHLMVELDVEPYEYIYESLKKVDPVLAEGWWDGVKDMAGKAWTAAKQVGKSMWDGGGLKHGLQQASDTMSGPDAKFAAADRALTDLVKILQRPEFQDFKTKDGGHKILDYYTNVLKDLRDNRNHMPKMTGAQVKQDYATKGQVKAQNAPGPQQQQQDAATQQNPSNREKFGYSPAPTVAGSSKPGMNVAS